MNVRGKKIFVGLSGGVDSAVSAALLKRAGAQVTGVFIKGWYPDGMPCTWAQERRDAMRVAARLHIPFRSFDASAEYKKSVVDYMLAEYRAGRTPNPDIMCNREVKFGAFYRYAMEEGADAIAMGHYLSGEKDQSYFLWAVPKDILASTLFPVGNMKKSEVRALAKKFNLPVAEKKDSQGVCFLGSVSIKEFLLKELGNNNPALLYTLGQRVGHEGLPCVASAKQGPWFVSGKDIENKKVMISRTRLPIQTTQKVFFTDANWFSESSRATEAQCRYRGIRITGKVEGNCFVSDNPLQEIPASGQSIVFYKDDELIGGGIIA